MRAGLGAYALAFAQPPGASAPPPLALAAELRLREAIASGLPLARAWWLLHLPVALLRALTQVPDRQDLASEVGEALARSPCPPSATGI